MGDHITMGPLPTVEQAVSPSDHNHSIITAVSNDNGTNNGYQTSPITSPLASRSKLNDATNGHDPFKVDSHMNHSAKFNDVLSSKSKELIALMKDVVAENKAGPEDPQLKKIRELDNDSFQWKSVVSLAESIFNDYSKEMESITKEFDNLNKVYIQRYHTL